MNTQVEKTEFKPKNQLRSAVKSLGAQHYVP
jgi:hypothetical protein